MTQTIEVRPTFEVTWEDVEYLPGLSARVYRPQGVGPFHALAEIHGGAWNNNDRTQNAPMVQEIAAHYSAIPLETAPELDASLAYVMMGWPVIDPHARYRQLKTAANHW